LRASTSKYCSATLVCALLASAPLAGAAATDEQPIELKLRPRVCTVPDTETACNTTVRAQWRSQHNESLCLLIADRPDIRHCWENHSEGTYSVELSFSEDLVVQLRDIDPDRVLASKTIAVIRQALRRKRRPPWNIFS
jgi:Protein of unknown function (DUF3019)